jgi:hypothetical protein
MNSQPSDRATERPNQTFTIFHLRRATNMNPNHLDRDSIMQRLALADPLTGHPYDEARDQAWLHETATAARQRSDLHDSATRSPRSITLLVGAAAAVAAGVTIGVVAINGPHSGVATGTESAPTVTELAMTADTPTMSSCLPFSVDALAAMPVAFSGKVIERDQDHVLLEVDYWYVGGGTDQVDLVAPDMTRTSLGDVFTFAEGGRYLLAATEGTVNYCGFSGTWNPQLAGAYAEAFPTS